MTRRWLDALLSARPALRPARALLSPVWLGALAVLGVNDHALKGAGVLPGLVTGKLSDVAGMLVAPVLLAALLGVRSRRGLLYCHITVGLVFALINVSPSCADAWSWLMGLGGFPWAITVDPTDLLALPALALGWRVLTPAMTAEPVSAAVRLPRWHWHSLPQAGAAAVGALLCVATSPSRPGDDDGWNDDPTYPPFQGDVYLHNSHAELDIPVRVRNLRTDVQIECTALVKDPGLLFSEPLFGEGVTWNIPPGANVPARQDDGVERDCHAVLLSSDTIAPTVLYWRTGEIPRTTIFGQHESEDEYLPGAVILTSDDDGVASIAGSERDIVFPQRSASAEAYLPQPDFHRVAWTDPPSGVRQILALEHGGDGCAAFTFSGTSSRFYLCTPLTELPFAPLEWVEVQGHGDDLLVLSRVPDPGDPADVPDVELAVSRGAGLPVIAGATLAAKPLFSVDYGPEPKCGTVALPQEFAAEFGGKKAVLRAGESVALDNGEHVLTLHGVHAERRLLVATECAEGPDATGDDLELVFLWTESPNP